MGKGVFSPEGVLQFLPTCVLAFLDLRCPYIFSGRMVPISLLFF